MAINVIFNDFSFEIAPKRAETYDNYCKIIQWGRRNPTKFLEEFMFLEFLDHQKYIFLSAWIADIAVILASRSSGKACVLDTKIYPVLKEYNNKALPKTIGELKVGDIIYDENDLPTTVIHLNPIIFEDVYEVEFEDREKIECNKEHLWCVFNSTTKQWEVVDTYFIFQNLNFPLNNKYTFSVPLKGNKEQKKRIVNVRKTGKKKAMRCITVSNKSGLFLCGNNQTVTHNSYLATPFIMARSLLFPNHNSYLLAPSGQQSQMLFQKMEDLAKGQIASALGVSSFFLDECVRLNAKADPFTHSKQSYTVELYNGSTVNTLNSVAKNIVGVRLIFVYVKLVVLR